MGPFGHSLGGVVCVWGPKGKRAVSRCFTCPPKLRIAQWCRIWYHNVMEAYRAVIDTNVLYAGLYSATGASYRILRMIDCARVVPILSTALVFEYEEVLIRSKKLLGLSESDVDDILDALCFHGECRPIHFLWRPQLADPKDDHVLELAVAAGGADIVTHNTKDFAQASAFGVRVVAPAEILKESK